MAFWSLNGELSEEGRERWLRDVADKGLGGAFMHPRSGLVTEYLGDRWWDLWAHALEFAKKLGLHLQIYDENSYPSGFAGGPVPSRDPYTVAGHVSPLPIASVDQLVQMRETGFVEVGAGGNGVGIGDFQRTDNTLLSFGVTGYAAHLSHYSLNAAGYSFTSSRPAPHLPARTPPP